MHHTWGAGDQQVQVMPPPEPAHLSWVQPGNSAWPQPCTYLTLCASLMDPGTQHTQASLLSARTLRWPVGPISGEDSRSCHVPAQPDSTSHSLG